jgi:hypothetical protein
MSIDEQETLKRCAIYSRSSVEKGFIVKTGEISLIQSVPNLWLAQNLSVPKSARVGGWWIRFMRIEVIPAVICGERVFALYRPGQIPVPGLG